MDGLAGHRLLLMIAAKIAIDVGHQLLDRARLFEHDLEQQLVERVRVERHLARYGLVQNDARRVQIHAMIHVLCALGLLGRHVVTACLRRHPCNESC